MIAAIAIDDEPKALEIIALHAAKIPFLDLQHCFRDALEGIAWLQDHPVDLLFLDINMPGLSGLQFRPLTGEHTMIIFTTAYAEYAVESYEQQAVDYLVKPIRFDRFLKAVMRAHEWKTITQPSQPLAPSSPGHASQPANTLYVKSGTRSIRILVADILFIKKDGNYALFYTIGHKKIMTRLNVSQVLEMLPAGLFFQVHKSYIVALQHIRETGQQQVILDGHEIPVAKERWKELLAVLNIP